MTSMTLAARTAQLFKMAGEAHHSAIEAHGEPVPAQTAWEFITQCDDDYEPWIGEPMPRAFAAHYRAWARDWKRAQEIAAREVNAA